MPNFITYDMGPGKREDGYTQSTFSITQLTEEEATEYGELMKTTFIEHWKAKTKNDKLGI